MGEAAPLPPPPSSPSRSRPSPRLRSRPHPPTPARSSPASAGSPPARPQHPPTAPPTRRRSACNIHKKHTQVGATSPGRAPRRASAYLRAAAAALGKGRGRGCGGGVGGWGGWEGGSKPPQSALGEQRRSSEAATLCTRRRPGLGVSRPAAVSADAEGRCPSRAEGTRPGRGAGPGAGARARGARQKLR